VVVSGARHPDARPWRAGSTAPVRGPGRRIVEMPCGALGEAAAVAQLRGARTSAGSRSRRLAVPGRPGSPASWRPARARAKPGTRLAGRCKAREHGRAPLIDEGGRRGVITPCAGERAEDAVPAGAVPRELSRERAVKKCSPEAVAARRVRVARQRARAANLVERPCCSAQIPMSRWPRISWELAASRRPRAIFTAGSVAAGVEALERYSSGGSWRGARRSRRPRGGSASSSGADGADRASGCSYRGERQARRRENPAAQVDQWRGNGRARPSRWPSEGRRELTPPTVEHG
jgi:hypothetical protein